VGHSPSPDSISGSAQNHHYLGHAIRREYHGFVFATAGDSFAAAFERSSSAVDCAEAILEALQQVDWGTWPELKVRIGLHIGEADERDGNYFGPVVNQAARIMAVAHGDQCLLTDGVRDASGAATTDLGTHTLRDIDAPVPPEPTGDR